MPHPGEHKGKEGTARPSEADFEVSTENISSREVAGEVQPPGDQRGPPPPVLLPILREAPGPTCPHRGGQRAGGGLVSRKVINFGSANFMTEFNTVLGRGVGGARDSEDSDPPPAPAPSLSFRFLHRGTLTIQATIQSGLSATERGVRTAWRWSLPLGWAHGPGGRPPAPPTSTTGEKGAGLAQEPGKVPEPLSHGSGFTELCSGGRGLD